MKGELKAQNAKILNGVGLAVNIYHQGPRSCSEEEALL